MPVVVGPGSRFSSATPELALAEARALAKSNNTDAVIVQDESGVLWVYPIDEQTKSAAFSGPAERNLTARDFSLALPRGATIQSLITGQGETLNEVAIGSTPPPHVHLAESLRDFAPTRAIAERAVPEIGRRLALFSGIESAFEPVREAYAAARRAINDHDPDGLAVSLSSLDVAVRSIDDPSPNVRKQAAAMKTALARVFDSQPATASTPSSDGVVVIAEEMLKSGATQGALFLAAITADDHAGLLDDLGAALTAGALTRWHAADAADFVLRLNTALWTVVRDLRNRVLTPNDFHKANFDQVSARDLWALATARLQDPRFDLVAESQGLLREPAWQAAAPTWASDSGAAALSFAALPKFWGRHIGDRGQYATQQLQRPLGRALAQAILHGTQPVEGYPGEIAAEHQALIHTAYALYKGGGGQPGNASQALVAICQACEINPIVEKRNAQGRISPRVKTCEEIGGEVAALLEPSQFQLPDEGMPLEQIDMALRDGRMKLNDRLGWLDPESKQALRDMLDIRQRPAFGPLLGPPPGRLLAERMAREKNDRAFRVFASEVIAMTAMGLVSGGIGTLAARTARLAQASGRAIAVAKAAATSVTFTTGMAAAHGHLEASQYVFDAATVGVLGAATRLAGWCAAAVPGESAAADVLRLGVQHGFSTASAVMLPAGLAALSGADAKQALLDNLKLVMVLHASNAAIARLLPGEASKQLRVDANRVAEKMKAQLEAVERELQNDEAASGAALAAKVPGLRRELALLRGEIRRLSPALAATIPDPEAAAELPSDAATRPAVGPGDGRRRGGPERTTWTTSGADPVRFERVDEQRIEASNGQRFARTGHIGDFETLRGEDGAHYLLELKDDGAARLIRAHDGYLGIASGQEQIALIDGELRSVNPNGRVRSLEVPRRNQLYGVASAAKDITAGQAVEMRVRVNAAGEPPRANRGPFSNTVDTFTSLTLAEGTVALSSADTLILENGACLRRVGSGRGSAAGVYLDTQGHAFALDETHALRRLQDGPVKLGINDPNHAHIFKGQLIWVGDNHAQGAQLARDFWDKPAAVVRIGTNGVLLPASLAPGELVSLTIGQRTFIAYARDQGIEIGTVRASHGKRTLVEARSGRWLVLENGEAKPFQNGLFENDKGRSTVIADGRPYSLIARGKSGEPTFWVTSEEGEEQAFGLAKNQELQRLGGGSGARRLSGDDGRTTAIVHDGKLYAVVSQPESLVQLADKVCRRLQGRAMTLRHTVVYAPLVKYLETQYDWHLGRPLPTQAKANIDRWIISGESGVLSAALGNAAVSKLAQSEGLQPTAKRDFIYAIKSDSYNDGAIDLADYSLGQQLGVRPDDLAIFVLEGGKVRAATLAEVQAHLRKATGNGQARWMKDLPRPDDVRIAEHRTTDTAPARCIVVRRGNEQLEIPLDDRPPNVSEGALPSDLQIARALRRLPFAALKSLKSIRLVDRQKTGEQIGSERAAYDPTSGQMSLFVRPGVWGDTGTLSNIAHEIAGHGVEQIDPSLYKLLFEAVVLDHAAGASATRPYGETNIAEAWATLIERYAISDPTLPVTRPHQFALLSKIFENGGDVLGDPGRAQRIYASAMAAVLLAAMKLGDDSK